MLDAILAYFGSSFRTLFDFAKKGAHHGFIAHGGEIKGPTAEQASEEAVKMEGKTVTKTSLEKQ